MHMRGFRHALTDSVHVQAAAHPARRRRCRPGRVHRLGAARRLRAGRLDRRAVADPEQDFAHVMVAQEGYTPAYRDMTGVTEPTTVLTFRSSGDELLR